MKQSQVYLYILLPAVVSIVTYHIIIYTGLSSEPFSNQIPDILNHLSIDELNINTDEADSSKRTHDPALVISNLSSGLSVNKTCGVYNIPINKSAVRITNQSDPASNPCWGIDFAGQSSLLLRHYPKGFHPAQFSNKAQYSKYYDRWNWFLRIFPNTQSRYSYPPIF